MDRRRSGRNFGTRGSGTGEVRIGRARVAAPGWAASVVGGVRHAGAERVVGRGPSRGEARHAGRRVEHSAEAAGGERIHRRAGTVRTGRRPRARGAGEPAESLGDTRKMVRVFVGPVLRVGSESGRQHRAEVRVRVKNCVKNGSIQQQQENEGEEDETRLGRSPPCLSPLNYPDFSLPMGRTPGRDGETRGEVSRRARAGGARRILVAKSAGFGFSSFFAGRNSPRDARVRERRGSDEPGFARAVTTRRRYPHLVDH